ncbi:acetyltransferase [Polynucleobacter paneuropaeus]|nr:acetyltransferase [Polynucleobacter paneuropaeus]
MKILAIYGAGGHGKVVADMAASLGWQEVVFYDDSWPESQFHGPWKVVGDYSNLLMSVKKYSGVLVGIGNCRLRLAKYRELYSLGAPMVSLVHPRAIVSSRAFIGAGSVVFGGAVINIDAKIGDACIINTGSTVDHDCMLADGVHICPGANLSGGVEVGEASWVGVGSCIKQGIKIDSNVMIGAGAVIINDVQSNSTMIGVAASQLKI